MNPRVNQKLYCARLALDAAQGRAGVAETALLEAALFHLITAYRCYLAEVADERPPLAATDAQDALRQQQQRGLQRKPELDELVQLEQNGAWPQRMLAAYAAVTASIEPKRESLSELSLTDITASVEADNCRQWLGQLQRLVQRQREHAHEW